MNTFSFPPSARSSALLGTALAALVWCGTVPAAEPVAEHAPAPGPAQSEVLVPKSFFADGPQAGKDPFFPNSTRRLEAAVTTNSTNAVAPSSFLSQLALKGISGTKGQLLAIINNATLAAGELAEVKVGGRTVKIRCREIRDRSVLIELEGGGEVKELKLRDGI